MQEATAHAAIFVTALLAIAALLALGWRIYRRRQMAAAGAELVSLSEAARVACRQAVAERLAIASNAEEQKAPGGAVAWFEHSIRQVVPAHGASPEQITRADLKRYMDWARTVQ